MDETSKNLIVLRLCGLNVSFSGPGSILTAIRSRFDHSPLIDSEGADMCFEYVVTLTIDQYAMKSPRRDGRVFYESSFGRASYFAEDDCCRFDLDSRARAFCFPGTGKCIVYLQSPALEQRWVAAHPLLTLPLLEMLKRKDVFFIHAAAFAIDIRCLLLPGSTGAGKSTLSVALLLEGMSYMGDDLSMLAGTDAKRILALPERISLTEGTREMFKYSFAADDEAVEPGFPKHEMSSTTWSNADVCWQASPALLIFPRIAHAADSVLSPMSRDEAFSLLAPNLLLTDVHSTQRHLNALSALAKKVDAFRLETGTDIQRTAVMIRSLLQ